MRLTKFKMCWEESNHNQADDTEYTVRAWQYLNELGVVIISKRITPGYQKGGMRGDREYVADKIVYGNRQETIRVAIGLFDSLDMK